MKIMYETRIKSNDKGNYSVGIVFYLMWLHGPKTEQRDYTYLFISFFFVVISMWYQYRV